jgi:hypothetical protein
MRKTMFLRYSCAIVSSNRCNSVIDLFYLYSLYMTAYKHFPPHVELLSCPALIEERNITAHSWRQTEIGRQTVMAEIERIGRYYQQEMIGDF